MNGRHKLAGYGARRIGMEFVLWAQGRRGFPDVEQVVSEFDVTKATAHRWLNDYADATGQLRQALRGRPRFSNGRYAPRAS